MKRLLPALLLGLLPAHAATEPSDLLRFTNGDRLDGHFAGLKPGPVVLWQRGDVEQPVEFKSTQLRQAVLRGGHAAKPFADLSSVALTNGDRIPGTVVALDATNITVDTAFAGPVVLSRGNVGMLAPNPLGGKILYSGPFSEEGWKVVTPTEEPVGLHSGVAAGIKAPAGEAEKAGPWTYSSGSYYSRSGTSALIRDARMPDRSLMRFQVAWKNRLALALAFHADLKPAPEVKPEEGKPVRQDFNGTQNFAKMFGNSYVLNLYTNYVILYRCSYDKDGKPSVERIQSGSTNIRLSETGEAIVELRTNRQTGEISLFLNDEFAIQWNESPDGPEGYAGKGGAIGFQVQGPGSPVRISDLVVAEWNGMPDSARSLQTDDQDIVLLTNGTDRFSGEVSGLSGDKLQLKGRYGNFEFPLSEIAEVRFAKKHLAKLAEPPSNQMAVRFHPYGKISGTPSEGDKGTFTLTSPLSGKMTINLDYAVMLDFKNTTSFLDDWDPEF
jgi:hypothetical protein